MSCRNDHQKEVLKVLDHLDEIHSAAVDQNMELICMLMNELNTRLREEKGILRGTRIETLGGAYENLAMNSQTDYDLVLLLAQPFLRTFKITGTFGKKDIYYKLKATERNAAEKKGRGKKGSKKERLPGAVCVYKKVSYSKKNNKLTSYVKIDGKKIFEKRKIKKVKSPWKINARDNLAKKFMREITRSGRIGSLIVYRRKKRLSESAKTVDMFYSKKKNLKTKELRLRVFSRLSKILSNITLDGAEVTWSLKEISLQLVLHCNKQRQIQLAIIPEIIGCSWDKCPGLVALKNLPKCLQDYLVTRTAFLYIIPAMPYHVFRTIPFDVCCMVDFVLLENHFFKRLPGIFDIVRLANVVKNHMDWTAKFGLESFHLKRVAIKNVNKLRNMETWAGLKILLQCLGDEMKQGGVMDCFVRDQIIFGPRSTTVKKFLHEMEKVRHWKPERLTAMVRRL